MPDTIIMIDGEYVRKIFINQNYKIHVPRLVDQILEELHIGRDDLLRAYYYTSPPYQSSKPTDEEKDRYRNFQKFIEFLDRQDSFEIKLGKTEKRGDNQFSQKMVDVLLSIDLVDLSAKSKIKTAILVAGDSDFVPAVKKAKDNGVRVILCCSNNRKQYHESLWKEVDKRVCIDESFMRKCCQ